jgi:hypothetical protein
MGAEARFPWSMSYRSAEALRHPKSSYGPIPTWLWAGVVRRCCSMQSEQEGAPGFAQAWTAEAAVSTWFVAHLDSEFVAYLDSEKSCQ